MRPLANIGVRKYGASRPYAPGGVAFPTSPTQVFARGARKLGYSLGAHSNMAGFEAGRANLGSPALSEYPHRLRRRATAAVIYGEATHLLPSHPNSKIAELGVGGGERLALRNTGKLGDIPLNSTGPATSWRNPNAPAMFRSDVAPFPSKASPPRRPPT